MLNPFHMVGGAVKIASNWEKNRQDILAAQLSAATHRMNAAYDRFLAGEARAEGQSEAALRDLKTSGEIGRLRADFGASGVDANVGTPRALYADARALGDYDAALIRHKAELVAAGRDFDAKVSTINANFQSRRASSLKRTGVLDAVSSAFNLGPSISF